MTDCRPFESGHFNRLVAFPHRDRPTGFFQDKFDIELQADPPLQLDREGLLVPASIRSSARSPTCLCLMPGIATRAGGSKPRQTVWPYRFVADIDAALKQQAFDIAQSQRKPDVPQRNQADHLGRRVEIAQRAGWFSGTWQRRALPQAHRLSIGCIRLGRARAPERRCGSGQGAQRCGDGSSGIIRRRPPFT
jgi:hypothetical protein